MLVTRRKRCFGLVTVAAALLSCGLVSEVNVVAIFLNESEGNAPGVRQGLSTMLVFRDQIVAVPVLGSIGEAGALSFKNRRIDSSPSFIRLRVGNIETGSASTPVCLGFTTIEYPYCSDLFRTFWSNSQTGNTFPKNDVFSSTRDAYMIGALEARDNKDFRVPAGIPVSCNVSLDRQSSDSDKGMLTFAFPSRLLQQQLFSARTHEESEQSNRQLQHRLCYYPSLRPSPSKLPEGVGRIVKIQEPQVVIPTPLPQFFVPVRIFLDPGWKFGVEFRGKGFSADHNRLVLKLESCSGSVDDHNAYKSIRPEKILPDPLTQSFSTPQSKLYADDEYSSLDESFQIAYFKMVEDNKVTPNELPRWRLRNIEQNRSARPKYSFHLTPRDEPFFVDRLPRNNTSRKTSRPFNYTDVLVRFNVCFFSSDQQIDGVPVGFVTFYSDHEDSAELVSLIIFAVIGIPFIFGFTISCYSHRHRRLRQRLKRLRLRQRRDEIEQRLLHQIGAGNQPEETEEDESMCDQPEQLIISATTADVSIATE